MSRSIGKEAEDCACDFLKKQGLFLIGQNYHCRWGEIDLIMRDKNELVFVEVRYRKSEQFGDALATVTTDKQKKLIKTAQHYLNYYRVPETRPIRFDVLVLQGVEKRIEWINDAFGIDY